MSNDPTIAQLLKDLLAENEQLRIALGNLVLNVLEDVPTEMMTEHLAGALFDAQQMLADLGDIDHNEENAE